MELITIALIGLIIGSFLNVCVWRVPRRESVVSPMRSYCPKCKEQLSWWQNIPILSWIILGAKCHSCKAPISGQYPLVEALSGIAAVGTYIRFGLTPDGIVLYAFTASLIVITFIDLEHKIIPDVISLPGVTFGLALGIVSQYTGIFGPIITQSAWDSLVGMFAGGGFFWVIGVLYFLVTKQEGLGGGDVKLMGMVGALLGWQSIPTTILAGSIAGSIVGVGAMIVTGAGRRTEIPFGPWLSLGALVYVFSDFRFFGPYF